MGEFPFYYYYYLDGDLGVGDGDWVPFPFPFYTIPFRVCEAMGLGWGSFVQAQARQRSLIGSCMGAGPALLVAGQVGEERDDI